MITVVEVEMLLTYTFVNGSFNWTRRVWDHGAVYDALICGLV